MTRYVQRPFANERRLILTLAVIVEELLEDDDASRTREKFEIELESAIQSLLTPEERAARAAPPQDDVYSYYYHLLSGTPFVAPGSDSKS